MTPIAEYLGAMRAAVGDNREFWFPMDRETRKDRALYLARELGSGLASYTDAEIKKAMGGTYSTILVQHCLDSIGVPLDAKDWVKGIQASIAKHRASIAKHRRMGR